LTPELFRDNQPLHRRRRQPVIGVARLIVKIDESQISIVPAAPIAEAAPAKSDEIRRRQQLQRYIEYKAQHQAPLAAHMVLAWSA
jgi:hypothetical protein